MNLSFRPAELKRKLAMIEDVVGRLSATPNGALSADQHKVLAEALTLKRSILNQLLRPLAVFRELPDSTFDALVSRMRSVSFEVDEPLFVIGDKPSWVGILVMGGIEISDGHHEVLHTVRIGEQFGHLPILWDEQTRFVEARATKETLVMRLSRAAYVKYWCGIHDTEPVARARFLRDLAPLRPLSLRDLAALDMRCAASGALRTFPRGAVVRSSSVGTDGHRSGHGGNDGHGHMHFLSYHGSGGQSHGHHGADVYAIYEGECQLVLVPKRRGALAGNRSSGGSPSLVGASSSAVTSSINDIGSSGNVESSDVFVHSVDADVPGLVAGSSQGGAAAPSPAARSSSSKTALVSASSSPSKVKVKGGSVGLPLAYVGRKTLFSDVDFGMTIPVEGVGEGATLALVCVSEVRHALRMW